MAVNYSNVTFGSPVRGWTAGSIAPAPRAAVADTRNLPPADTRNVTADTRGPVANIGTSGNIPTNIMQAIGNLTAQQAFQNFLSGSPSATPQAAGFSPQVVNYIDQAAILRAQNEAARQQAAQAAASSINWQLSGINQSLKNLPTQFGGILPMGMGAERAALQQQQFGLENQLAMANAGAFGIPRMSGWVGGF